MNKIDLNCDLGESFGIYELNDKDILPHITSANIACGFHAGDPAIMFETIKLTKQYNIAVGAHPSFPDLQGFGRREMNYSADDVYRLVLYQIGALYSFCKAHNIALHHVKPHGALYNQAARDINLALAISKAIKNFDSSLILYGLSNSKLIEAAIEMDIPYASEVFADRLYNDDGSLVNRNIQNAIHQTIDGAVNQAIQIVLSETVQTVNGNRIHVKADTICLHSDSKIAIQLASKLREAFEKSNITICSIGV